ncbi:hypothetical protein ES703_61125 [subsurface metagenome]
MAEKCLCEASEVLIFPCSGGSNCGQIANQAAVQLAEEGIGRMYCLAGIGAHDSVMIDTAKAAKRIVAIDGCSTACAKRTLEHAGLMVTDYLDVTEEWIEKVVGDFKLSLEDISSIAAKVKERLGQAIIPG